MRPNVRLSANLSMLFTEAPYLKRFGLAARHGFRAVESLFPYGEAPASAVAAELERHGMEQVLVNAPPGDWAGGERGVAALPDRGGDHEASLREAFVYAAAIGCPRVHVLAGLRQQGACEQTFVERLRAAAGEAQSAGITLCVEALNPSDVPGYLLPSQARRRRVRCTHSLRAKICAEKCAAGEELHRFRGRSAPAAQKCAVPPFRRALRRLTT